MTSNLPPTEQEANNIVPVNGTTTLVKPDPLLEELNVVRIEGRYFSFDKHEAKKKNGIYEYRDGDRGIVIETNPRYGQPSIIAYKVLQAVFRKITLEGRPYPETVAFSYSELARMIGRDVMGGNDSKQLFTAIRQLQDTKIELYLYDQKSGKRQQFSSRRFELIITTGLIGEGRVDSPRLKAAVLTIHPLIMDSMRQGRFAIFNWSRISQLEPAERVNDFETPMHINLVSMDRVFSSASSPAWVG
jgi:Replication initiator protein A.